LISCKDRDIFYNEETSAILNSLTVFLCNRISKHNRILNLKQLLLNLLDKNNITTEYTDDITSRSKSQKSVVYDLSSFYKDKGFKISSNVH
jgi:hypothetical protein